MRGDTRRCVGPSARQKRHRPDIAGLERPLEHDSRSVGRNGRIPHVGHRLVAFDDSGRPGSGSARGCRRPVDACDEWRDGIPARRPARGRRSQPNRLLIRLTMLVIMGRGSAAACADHGLTQGRGTRESRYDSGRGTRGTRGLRSDSGPRNTRNTRITVYWAAEYAEHAEYVTRAAEHAEHADYGLTQGRGIRGTRGLRSDSGPRNTRNTRITV